MSDMSELRKQDNHDIADLHERLKITELGPIPEEWEVVNLGRVFVPVKKEDRSVRIEKGRIYKTLTVKLYAQGITLRQEIEGDKIGTAVLYRTKANDFVFSKIDARNGAWGFVPEELDGGLVSGDFPILQLDNTVADRDFIALSLSRPITWEPLRDIAVGTTNRRRIQVQQLLHITIPLPPLPEQRAIAHVLRTIQRAKETTERVIQATRELKKSLMHYLFTYGPVPVDEAEKVPLKETEIGLVPEHWEVVRLGEIASVRSGTSFPLEYQGTARGDYPFFKVSDMNLPGNETEMHRANNYVSEQVRQVLGAKLFPAGTIIFPKVGGALHTNKKRLLQQSALIDNNIMGVTVADKNRCVPDFLFRWFETVRLSDLCNPGPLPSINATRVKNYYCPIPPLPEQRTIAHILGVIDKKLQAEEDRKQALEALFKTLLHNLMTGKIRVKDLLVESGGIKPLR